tara:strand:- start:336 stop:497 length:162 start_codon:yes stop_codon:yes gene_type:complete
MFDMVQGRTSCGMGYRKMIFNKQVDLEKDYFRATQWLIAITYLIAIIILLTNI